jgi:putative membrane protein
VHNHGAGADSGFVSAVIIGALAAVALFYVVPAVRNRARRPWPRYRSVLWIAGLLVLLVATVGPVAAASETSFTGHMLGHLLIGMLTPLLFVLAAPVTLALRSLDVVPARRLSALLRMPVVRFFVHPVVATVLNIGGLWLLYTTELFPAMHESALLMLAVHAHVFIAGYLFTASMISIDPAPHRPGYLYRAIVLVAALAGHDILAKYLYGHPPIGVEAAQAEAGGLLMYYGGDAIDLVLIIALCAQWFAATRPRVSRDVSLASGVSQEVL